MGCAQSSTNSAIQPVDISGGAEPILNQRSAQNIQFPEKPQHPQNRLEKNQVVAENTQAVKIEGKENSQSTNGKQVSYAPQLTKGRMPFSLEKSEPFIQHHLRYETELCKFASADYIKMRQILEHQIHNPWNKMNSALKTDPLKIQSSSVGTFFQRVLLDIFENAEREYFVDQMEYEQVRRNIVERFLFQFYQLKEFLDAGMGQICVYEIKPRQRMSFLLSLSDGHLYPILKCLKQKYPQVSPGLEAFQFPKIDEKTVEINLLSHFPSQCYASPKSVNIQTIFNDLKFLFDRAANEYADFKKDMESILGKDVKTDYKVKITDGQDGSKLYNASAVRRILIKWMEATLQQIPEVVLSQSFLEFIQYKSVIMDNFHFKSTVHETTHSIIVNFISEFLEKAKYDIWTLKENKKFGFYIYDLLRCKIKKNTTKDLVTLLESVKKVTKTPSGKKFEIVRIRDRFKSVNRDVLLNIKYGDVLIMQCQLTLDNTAEKQVDLKNSKFGHYCYELERGLFGPTLEMIMQHEDFERTNIKVNLKAEGVINKRQAQKALNFLKKVDRKCLNGHGMISLKGNYIVTDEDGEYTDIVMVGCVCAFCKQQLPLKQIYHYCYYCAEAFCTNCEGAMATKMKTLERRCNVETIPEIKKLDQLKQKFDQYPVVVFYLKKGTSSRLFKDVMTEQLFEYTKIMENQKKIPKIYAVSCDDNSTKDLYETYKVKEFPTTILFDKQGVAQITVVGASIKYMEAVFKAQQRLNKGRLKYCIIDCWCKTPMKFVGSDMKYKPVHPHYEDNDENYKTYTAESPQKKKMTKEDKEEEQKKKQQRKKEKELKKAEKLKKKQQKKKEKELKKQKQQKKPKKKNSSDGESDQNQDSDENENSSQSEDFSSSSDDEGPSKKDEKSQNSQKGDKKKPKEQKQQDQSQKNQLYEPNQNDGYSNPPQISKRICSCCQNDSVTFEEDEAEKKDLLYKIAICPMNHILCKNCAFMANPNPSKYKDYKGMSYLVEKRVENSPANKCLKGHNMKHVLSIKENKECSCIKCKKTFLFDNTVGANYCEQCSAYECEKCENLMKAPDKKNPAELIAHSVEASAEEGEHCVCGRLFKKVYHSRDYSYNIYSGNKGRTLEQNIPLIYKPLHKQWKCGMCNQKYPDGELHLACFNCPRYLNQINHNLEICMKCAIEEQIINRPVPVKLPEAETDFICKNSHPVMKVQKSYNADETSFDCNSCKKSFYIHTERFYCKTCKITVCLDCGFEQTNKWISNPKLPKATKKCYQNHELRYFGWQSMNTASFKLCNECMVPLRNAYFSCPVFNQSGYGCYFDLCIQCGTGHEKKKNAQGSKGLTHHVNNALDYFESMTDGDPNSMYAQMAKQTQQMGQYSVDIIKYYENMANQYAAGGQNTAQVPSVPK